MMCLSFSVLVTNYLFGTGSRWIVLLLLAGGRGWPWPWSVTADGQPVATARADLVAQGALALAMGVAFVAIHLRHRGRSWCPVAARCTPRGPGDRTAGDHSGSGRVAPIH